MPSFYFGRAQMFAGRDLRHVTRALHSGIQAAVVATERSMFVLHGCRIGNKQGLYARDMFNRDRFRQQLVSAGLQLSPEPYLEMQPDGSFVALDGDRFEPSFVILRGLPEDEEEVATFSGALTAFILGTCRLGKVTPEELTTLSHLGRNVVAIAADHDPALLLSRLAE